MFLMNTFKYLQRQKCLKLEFIYFYLLNCPLFNIPEYFLFFVLEKYIRFTNGFKLPGSISYYGSGYPTQIIWIPANPDPNTECTSKYTERVTLRFLNNFDLE